jgi:ribosomal protein S12 methylthiotransferase
MNKKRVNIVTLGCSKNEVDTELMQGILDRENFEYVNSTEKANIIIVNTCGFIVAAKEESIDTILEMANYKTQGECSTLVLAGCLAQRYSKELLDEIPEIDGIIGTGNIKNLNNVLIRLGSGEKIVSADDIDSEYIESIEREVNSSTSYIRISEGCDNLCTYCIIPQLRGKHRSRKMEDIIQEAASLGSRGVREIILIAQNTSDYGIDIYGKYSLGELLDRLNDITEIEIIRLLYVYPDNIDDDLIESIARNKKVAKYLDIPLQHASNRILKLMNRKTTKESIEETITKLRNRIPGIILRTTFIVGFPGETTEDFDELLKFVRKIKFDKLGVFCYSREENTPAFSLPNQVEEEVKVLRRDKLMENQSKISEKIMGSKVGETYNVLVEEFAEEGMYVGRSYMDSPEIDGVFYVKSNRELDVGEIVKAKVIEYLEYDLIGELEDESCE